MNIIAKLIERIEDYRKTNKNPCKSYANEATANKAAERVSKEIALYFSDNPKETPEYIVFYNPAWGRWCVAFNITKLLNKYGGYAGVASEKGFFSY